MQDNYVGDIGDYGKYGLLRNVTAAGLRLAVWQSTGTEWFRLARANRRTGNTLPTWISRKFTDSMIRNCLTVWLVWYINKNAISNKLRTVDCLPHIFSRMP